jgi:hypothetical protein
MDDEKRCAICGKPAEDEHHLIGRGHAFVQLDPTLTADVCHDDHELLHDDCRRQGIDKPLQSTNIFERIERFLQRVGVFLGRVGEATGIAWCIGLAGSCARFAGELHTAIMALDGWDLGWRGAL